MPPRFVLWVVAASIIVLLIVRLVERGRTLRECRRLMALDTLARD